MRSIRVVLSRHRFPRCTATAILLSVQSAFASAHDGNHGSGRSAGPSGQSGHSASGSSRAAGDGNGNHNGNGNIGSFNGNLNGNGNLGRANGNWNGNGNVGFGNGNLNGNRNTGASSGNRNGNANRGSLNGNLNGNSNGRVARGNSQHVSLASGGVHFRESFRTSADGTVKGRFSFHDGTISAKGVFTDVAGTWSFAFTIKGVPAIDRVVTTDGRLVQANFTGCLDCAGVGNVGAFEGLGNASPTSGNYNTGLFNGNFNGGTYNGNGNIGAFNGNFNGLGYAPNGMNGSYDGNANRGFFGNFNGGAPADRATAREIAASVMEGVSAHSGYGRRLVQGR